MIRRCLLWLLVLSLSACATREMSAVPAVGNIEHADAPFNVSGRLAVNYQGKGYSASFDWQHQPPNDEININSPLGNTLARVIRQPQGVSLESDGKTWQADNVESLTEQTLGWPLPLSGLVWWIRGQLVPGQPYTSQPENDGVIQQGWHLRFIYDAEQANQTPKRIEMLRDDLSLRLVPQAWR